MLIAPWPRPSSTPEPSPAKRGSALDHHRRCASGLRGALQADDRPPAGGRRLPGRTKSAEDVREPVDALPDGGSGARAPCAVARRPRSRLPATRVGPPQARAGPSACIDDLIRTGDPPDACTRKTEPGRPTRPPRRPSSLSSNFDDAAREVTQVTEASISRLVRIEIALASLAVAALALGRCCGAAGQGRPVPPAAANNLDLITAACARRHDRLSEPLRRRKACWRHADLVGTALGDLVHPDDQHEVERFFTELVICLGATATSGARLRHRGWPRRQVEIICTNPADQSRVHGLVLHPRRHRAGGAASEHRRPDGQLPDVARIGFNAPELVDELERRGRPDPVPRISPSMTTPRRRGATWRT